MAASRPKQRTGTDVLMRFSRFLRFAAAFAAVVAVLPVGLALQSRAEDDGFGSGFINPFPKGDIYKIMVIGDDLAEGLQMGLQEALITEGRVSLAPKHAFLNGVMRPDFDDKLTALETDLKVDPPHIAIVMLGLWDRVSLRNDAGKKIPVGTPDWQSEYGRRAERLLSVLKQSKIAVYSVGLPNVRKYDANEDAQMMNEVLRDRAFVNGMKFVDIYSGFLDEQGGFSAWGPDLTGKIVKLRDGEGLYFTIAGNRKLAHFVERDLRRDLNQARAERTVPLAGNETEQAKINPGKATVKESAPAASPQPGRSAAANGTGGSEPASEGDQKADNGRISLKTIAANGREEVVTLDIVRPAIPATVVALVTRNQSAEKATPMGQVLIDQIAGGLSMMSTITPPSSQAAGAARGAVSPTQTPYYRVLVKGERLTPRPGRADDIVWPRPEPKLIDIEKSDLPRNKKSELETGTAAAEPAVLDEPPAVRPVQKSKKKKSAN